MPEAFAKSNLLTEKKGWVFVDWWKSLRNYGIVNYCIAKFKGFHEKYSNQNFIPSVTML